MTDHRNLRSTYRGRGGKNGAHSDNNIQQPTNVNNRDTSNGHRIFTETSTPLQNQPQDHHSVRQSMGSPTSPVMHNTQVNQELHPDPTIHDNASIARNFDKLNKNISDLSESFNKKHDELSSKLDSRFKEYDTIIHSTTTLAKTNATEINDLKAIVDSQAQTIEDLRNMIITNEKTSATAINAVLTLANSIEAHQRRLSVRIFGLPAPTTIENPDQAKHIVLDFIRDQILIDNVTMDDLDCSHRVGDIVDKTQTMLVRCFSRDLVQQLLASKPKLKGSTIMLHEDSTYLNRKLRLRIKNDPRVENAWLFHGAVWAKMCSNGKIAKFGLDEDILSKIQKESDKIINRPNKNQNKRPPNQRPTMQKTYANTPAQRLPHYSAPQRFPHPNSPGPAYSSYYTPFNSQNRFPMMPQNYQRGSPISFNDYSGSATEV